MKTLGRTSRAEAPVEPAIKSVQTRQRILDAAAGVFAQKGYKAASLNDIAEAASIKAGSMYFHFGSKDELIGEVLHEGMKRSLDVVKAAVDAAGEDAKPRARLRAAISAHIDTLRSLSGYAAAVLRIVEEVSPEIRVHFNASDRAYAHYWTSLVAGAQADGWFEPGADPKRVRRLLFGAMNAVDVRRATPASDAERKRLLIALVGLDDPQ